MARYKFTFLTSSIHNKNTHAHTAKAFNFLRYMAIDLNTAKYNLQYLDKVLCNKNHYWFKIQFAATKFNLLQHSNFVSIQN